MPADRACAGDGAARLGTIVDALCARLRADGLCCQRHETHISIVIVAGDDVWKFKKPVNFGFLDFSTLALRRHFCEREVELNRRYTPDLYLGVEAVAGPGPGLAPPPIEYAVHMKRFDTQATADVLVPGGRVTGTDIARFARQLAALHAAAPVAADGTPFGSATQFAGQVVDLMAAPLEGLLPPGFDQVVDRHLVQVRETMAERRAGGHVRECHGDLHLSNIVRHRGELVPFDCIEFSDALSTIDTASDAAFVLMDLDAYGAAPLGHAFLNSYLTASGDFAALDVLPLFLAYRSLVRAKVALLRARPVEDAAVMRRAHDHVSLARRYLEPVGRPGLVITHGLSGSGKTWHAARAAAAHGYIHLRSDIERRRAAGLPLDAASHSLPGAGLYTSAHTERTYARLRVLAGRALAAGFSVIVDATFGRRAERDRFAELAAALDVPFRVLACTAPLDELRRRVERRAAAGMDASEATVEVLEQQLATFESLMPGEQPAVLDPERFEAALTAGHEHLVGRARVH